MIVATHQPIFLPWSGFFHKAAHADRLVLLDEVQFPLGRSWITRNRLKNEQGVLWLRVPVMKKGRGLQIIREVEIYNEREWRKKHLTSIKQNYIHAPYFTDHYPSIEKIYRKNHLLLSEYNIELISYLMDAMSLHAKLIRQSDLGVHGKGTGLLIDICHALGADQYISLPGAERHIDFELMASSGINVARTHFRPPIYPQLWNDFIFNLSSLDLLLNCGPRSREIVAGAGGPLKAGPPMHA
ncbi:MAG: WbqC family protein [Desulfatiglans sp.]|nr:WbqC family protein [Desulfatiglans sp.]